MWIVAANVAALGYIAMSLLVVVNWTSVLRDDDQVNLLGASLVLVFPVLLVLFVRVTVAITDGSSGTFWIFRILGWLTAIACVVVATPIVFVLWQTDPALLCTCEPHLNPATVWANVCPSLLCHRANGLVVVGRWLVSLAIASGALSVSGAFGWVARRLRSRSRVRWRPPTRKP